MENAIWGILHSHQVNEKGWMAKLRIIEKESQATMVLPVTIEP